VRKGVKRPGAISALITLAVFTGWAGYTTVPHYSYYYQVAIQSSEDVSNLALYLPAGTVASEPYERLYSQEIEMPGATIKDFMQTIVDTEHGKMLRIFITTLKKDTVPVPRYSANIIYWEGRGLWQNIVPRQLIQLEPKSEVVQVNSITSQRFIGPVQAREFKTIERFTVPVKVTASTQAQIKLSLWNRTDRRQALNFAYTYYHSYPYTEQLEYDLQTDGEWQLIPVEANSLTDIQGMSD
jgi:hypothetical protein